MSREVYIVSYGSHNPEGEFLHEGVASVHTSKLIAERVMNELNDIYVPNGTYLYMSGPHKLFDGSLEKVITIKPDDWDRYERVLRENLLHKDETIYIGSVVFTNEESVELLLVGTQEEGTFLQAYIEGGDLEEFSSLEDVISVGEYVVVLRKGD